MPCPGVDDLILASRVDPTQRPHQLVVTCDQIYADDMPDAFQPMVTDNASKLHAAGP